MLGGDGKVTDLGIYFSIGNPTTTKQATFGVKGPFGDSCLMTFSQGVAEYVWFGINQNPIAIEDQTLDLLAYNIQLTDLGIYIGNNFRIDKGAWAGNVVIVTSSHTITE